MSNGKRFLLLHADYAKEQIWQKGILRCRWINKVVASFATTENAEAKANYPPPPLRSSHLSQGDRVNSKLFPAKSSSLIVNR